VFYWWAGEIGGPVAIGTVMMCSVGTYVALSMWAGTVADRVDRRQIMLLSDVGCAAVAGVMVLLALANPKPPIWVLCILAITLKTAYVFQIPARGASIPRLVPEDRLIEANSLNSASQTAMPLVGNTVGAMVLGAVFQLSAALAYVATFAINSLTFAVSAIFMARLPAIEPERDTPPKHPIQDARDGLAVIWRHPVLRASMLLFFAFEFFIAPFMPAYVVVAQTTMKEGFYMLGIQVKGPALLALLETGFFLGFVLGSLLVMRRPSQVVGRNYILFVFLGGLSMAPMGLVQSVPAFWMLNFLCGVLLPFGVIPMQTYMQTAAPDEYRGRVNAGIGSISAAAVPLGALISGPLIAFVGLAGAFAFIGLGLAGAGLAGALSKDFRQSRLPETKNALNAQEEMQDAEPSPVIA
jgi:MFS family permease